MPSLAPTGDPKNVPVLFDRYESLNFTYTCRPIHLHSSPNDFSRIFASIFLTTTAKIVKLVVTIRPYSAVADQLALQSDGRRWNVKTQLTAFGSSELRMEITNPTSVPFGISEWNSLMSFPAYRLNTDSFLPHSCPKFIDGQYPRTFSMWVVDYHGRVSNVIKRALDVRTAVIVYSNVKPVIISNAASFWKMVDIQQSLYDPVRGNPGLTNFTEGMPWADLASLTADPGK